MLQLLVGTIMVIVPKKKFNQHMIAYIVWLWDFII